MIAEHQRSRGPQSNVQLRRLHGDAEERDDRAVRETGPRTASCRAFHTYPMRQAIEESFILDVLQSYMTCKAYHALEKVVDDDPELNGRRARPKVARVRRAAPHRHRPEGVGHRRALPTPRHVRARRGQRRAWS